MCYAPRVVKSVTYCSNNRFIADYVYNYYSLIRHCSGWQSIMTCTKVSLAGCRYQTAVFAIPDGVVLRLFTGINSASRHSDMQYYIICIMWLEVISNFIPVRIMHTSYYYQHCFCRKCHSITTSHAVKTVSPNIGSADQRNWWWSRPIRNELQCLTYWTTTRKTTSN